MKETTAKERHPSASAPYPPQKLASRSCTACYQRKVRCDRAVPCSNCEKHGVSCVYPTRATTDADGTSVKKGPTLQSIANRLGRVEVLLTRLLEQTGEASAERLDGQTDSTGSVTIPLGSRVLPSIAKSTRETSPPRPIDPPRNALSPRSEQAQLSQRHSQGQQNPQAPSTTWEILLRDELDERALTFVGTPSMGQTPQSGHVNKSTSTSSTPASHLQVTQKHTPAPTQRGLHHDHKPGDNADVLALYPHAQLALQLWSVYVKHVDPVLKILHIPTLQSTVVQTILDPASAAASTLALTFAIYYAAVTSMCSADDDDNGDTSLPPEERSALLSQFKTALDALLTVRRVIDQPDIQCIQALAIYATCLRAHEVGRSVWILNGLAIRLAQSMGLHRDGSHLKLSPFETEMRLRLWWHLCILDSRAPEDQGLQPTIAVTNWELRVPRNVNDAQLYPAMVALPAASTGWTDMSFFLLQTEACRRMHPLMETLERQSGPTPGVSAEEGNGDGNGNGDGGVHGTPSAPIDVADGIRRIRARHESIRDAGRYMHVHFGVSPDTGRPTDLPRIATTHMETACKKMEFVLQLREEILLKRFGGTSDVDAASDASPLETQSFALACETLACSRTLLRDSRAAHYGWFFNMYTQWYALAYVLRCLCLCGRAHAHAAAEHRQATAWALVDELFPSGLRLHERPGPDTLISNDSGEASSSDASTGGHADDGSIWSYLHRLRQQAALVREQALNDDLVSRQSEQSAKTNNTLAASYVPVAGLPPADGDLAEMQLPAADASLPSAGLVQDNNQEPFSSLDLFMADIQFLPDWDTVINM
ncbi:uncharacterized protein SPSK_03057 [Sporothrix schenckii 1099-18]|uniref:Zn(2)-C6 fungal-type domain-containing protein n=1 Tax=Sporothrix schenckii 1099-18 TaxID=1397361 RepID=A0A0F2LZW1_SPOSC|nr:uncharacterized protein SPSK_03057 [Sporothrix schenckii 1099-18]KJR82040.1 hypothetical protein SPSK_03057 [Sporothrix schenckii 1099-18]